MQAFPVSQSSVSWQNVECRSDGAAVIRSSSSSSSKGRQQKIDLRSVRRSLFITLNEVYKGVYKIYLDRVLAIEEKEWLARKSSVYRQCDVQKMYRLARSGIWLWIIPSSSHVPTKRCTMHQSAAGKRAAGTGTSRTDHVRQMVWQK